MYPPQSAPTFTPAKPSLNPTANALILAGAIVGLAMAVFTIAMGGFMFAAFSEASTMVGGQPFPSFALWMPVMFVLMAALSIVGAIIAFSARGQLLRSNGAEGSTKAIVAGAIMIVGMGMLGGILVLIGGILAAQPGRA